MARRISAALRRAFIAFVATALLGAAVGCESAESPRDDGGASACGLLPDGGSPQLGECPPQVGSCHTCENQLTGGCQEVCVNHGCWQCDDGRWGMVSVDCDPFCNQRDATAGP